MFPPHNIRGKEGRVLYGKLKASIVIHEDAVASFNQQGHEWAHQHFQRTLGAKVLREFDRSERGKGENWGILERWKGWFV